MKDGELIRLLRRDPYEGMMTLSRLYAGLLYAGVRARLPEEGFGSSQVEEIVADTLSAFFLSLDSFHPQECSIRSYLCVMARNRAVDILRASRITVLPPEELQVEDSLDVADQRTPHPGDQGARRARQRHPDPQVLPAPELEADRRRPRDDRVECGHPRAPRDPQAQRNLERGI